MKLKYTLLLAMILWTCEMQAQWAAQAGIGMSNPVTGYKTITNSGILYQLNVSKRLKNDRWGVGLMLGWGRMHNDDNASDVFENARLDQVPILVTADYELSDKKWNPYLGFGMGVSLYNLSYDLSPTAGETEFNASFSMMPALGLRMKVNDKVFPFIEANYPMVMDGPPPGTGKADKTTGYIGIALGAAYRF